MAVTSLSKLANLAKKWYKVVGSITDELGKQVTGIDKKKIVEAVKEKIKKLDFEKLDEDQIRDYVQKEIDRESNDPTPKNDPAPKATKTKTSLRERREARKQAKAK